ncbi:bifunctional 5,10-methylenetetrahydrofolate dehydrogenase/5,10-methenyltetrahydrofolate cyclohydrolase [Pseudonocardia alni]|uniref:bifunctional 5,10-methylenetetrahydrofolate dehydrogenase/5,10-methenyltetrahydrofolate cyclohydrolase n=1 Tax=Pseudonocardia alni TaxID=33907 RepID=UPI00280A8FD1|nr:tetrahydrofolate dehydrogenase/cyclohydrolase catalytic domain-containing protein [Pseudonocardia alni]
MTAQVIDGRACARAMKAELIDEVAQVHGHATGLATIMVGDDYGSVAYERRLQRLAREVGIAHFPHRLEGSAGIDEVSETVERLNTDDRVSGILVLRPLPPGVDESAVFRAIDPGKDVEAVHPENAGLLALGTPRFVPSTAASVFHLLDSWLDSVGEDRADFYHRSSIVVVGRSNNVGKPAISLGYEREATVQSVDVWADRTTGIGRHTRWADVLIVAAGKAGLVKAEHVSDNAIVIDVGINPMTGVDGRVHMVGDVDVESVAPRVRALTPVPGGVGPVTDVWLLRNTVLAARLRGGAGPQTESSVELLEVS